MTHELAVRGEARGAEGAFEARVRLCPGPSPLCPRLTDPERRPLGQAELLSPRGSWKSQRGLEPNLSPPGPGSSLTSDPLLSGPPPRV